MLFYVNYKINVVEETQAKDYGGEYPYMKTFKIY